MQSGILLCSSVLAIGVSVPATAQESSSTTTAITRDDQTIGDIIVTAQKREQKLQEVPISIEVVSSKKLQDFNITDFRSMVKFIPNVSVYYSTGNDAIYLRGFGSSPGNYAFESTVALYVDGIYAGHPKQAQGPFFDLARVEVLRGPQGALFGKNTAAGAISVISAGPTARFEASAKALYNFDLKGPAFEGFISGPLSDQFGARLAFKYIDQDGYLTNRRNGRKEPTNRQILGRLTLRYEPSASFDYTIKAEYADTKVKGGSNVSQALTEVQHPVTTRYTDQDPFGQEGQWNKAFLASGTGNLMIGDHALTAITGYSQYRAEQRNDWDQTIPGGGGAVTNNSPYNTFPERFHQFSQEVRLASPAGGRFEYVVGAYYDTSHFELVDLLGFDIRAAPIIVYTGQLRSDFDQHSDSYSVFGQGTFRFNDTLRILGSLRYSDTKKRASYNSRLLAGPFPLLPLTVANGRVSENSVDPSATIQYDVVPRTMVYATYARGSKSGGFVSNTFGVTDATFAFKAEKSKSFEAGVKSTLADGKVVLNLSIYNTKFTDLQVTTYDGNTNSFKTSNAGQATSKGLEGSAAFYPSRNLDFTLSGAYQNVKYGDFIGGGCLASQTVAQCDPANPLSVAVNNLKGTRVPYTPNLSYSVQGHYRLALPNSSAIDATVAVSGRSRTFTSQDLSTLYGLQKAYAKVDARVQYSVADERWHVAVVGKNLTNEKTVSSSYTFMFPVTNAPRAVMHIEETRNIALEAGLKF